MERLKTYLRLNPYAIPTAIIILSLAGIFFLQTVTIAQQAEQLKHQGETLTEIKNLAIQLKKNADQRSKQINSVDRHLDCIVKFFSQPDRSEKAIKDIERCRIAVNSGSNSVASSQPFIQPQPSQKQQAQTSTKPKNTKKDKSTQKQQSITGIPLVDTILSKLGGN